MNNTENNKNTTDTYSYKGWLNSDSFLKRAFGVWGHMFVAQLIIGAITFFFVVLMAILIGIAVY